VNNLNFGGHNHIPGTASHLRRCQHSLPVSVINIHRRDLYSAARLSRRNGFCCATQLW